MMKFVKHVTILILLIVSLLPASGNTQLTDNVQIMTASPGDTVTFNGKGTPCSEAKIDISVSVTVDAKKSNGQWLYDLSMNNVKILGGKNGFSITASPVNTMTVWGSYTGIRISRDIGVSGGTGSFSVNNVPVATYSIGVKGVAQGEKVRLDVHAMCHIKVNKDGKYTVSLCTNGMPAGVYTVTQDGCPIATVYLGVAAPSVPTPTPTVCPSPSAPCVPDDVLVPAAHVALPCLSNKEIELASCDKIELASEDLEEAQISSNDEAVVSQEDGSVPTANVLLDEGAGLGLIMAALAVCGICGAGGYFLLFKRK